MRKIKFSVAVVLVNPDNNEEVLAVQRPKGDELGEVWGLPAVSIKGNELPEQAVRRVGIEKLNTKIEPIEFVGVKYANRGEYDLVLIDIRAKLVGEKPNVAKASVEGDHTKYVAQRWTSDPDLFKPAAQNGSLCSQIYLESKEINWKE